MTDLNLDIQLEKILSDLGKVGGVEGSLISDSNGTVLCHDMARDTDILLFGPMAHVITSSSKRLLNSAGQGGLERVLVESKRGKALFLHLKKVDFIVLMEVSANVGLVMVSAKRAAKSIDQVTKDMILPIEIEIAEEIKEAEEEPVPVTEEIPPTKEEIIITPEKTEEVAEESTIIEASSKIGTPEESAEIEEKSEVVSETIETTPEIEIESESLQKPEKIESESEIDLTPDMDKEHEEEIRLEEIETESLTQLEAQDIKAKEVIEPETHIPIIKPPISFPELPKDVEIPEGMEERSNLILDIYESIFLAMSIGASKIMGVAPARGLIKQFLPLGECKKLLDGVSVKSNSAVDFDKIRENIQKIPLEERENTIITDFSKIIDIITENYGKVMGYGAFRGMVRPQFKIITESYGNAMDELGIKGKIHPELTDLFE